MKSFEFSSLPIEQLYQVLQSSPQGISALQASKRMQAQRRASKTKSPFGRERVLLIRQFTNPLVLLLVVAVLLSALLGEFADTLIILFILLATGLLGFWQELHAGRAMEKLYKMVEMNSTLVRGGKQQNVPNNEVVMGDVLLLDAGDIIAADCRIIESNELHVDESTLTGESYPVEKSAGERADYLPIHEKTNCVWQGTTVISGMARALVVHTGNDTIFGQMSHSLLQTPETAFEKGIKRFGYFLLRITIVLSLIILLTNLYFNRPFFDSVLFSLALAVGMAPELLPAIMTFAMAAGAKRMMQKQVIVKKLSAIFNFGEVNVLCTDKTGTITQGEITVNRIINTRGETDDRLRLFAFLNARFQSGYTNPIDRAIALLPLGPTGYEKLNEIPYDFIRKRLSIAVKKQEQALFITKGALLSVLEVCTYVEEVIHEIVPISKDFRRKIEESNAHYSQQGYKVLGLAYKAIASEKISRADEQDMIFLGYILLEDPLKQSTVISIERLKQLDISIKIITGDNRYAAAQIAQELGLNKSHVLTGEELNHLSPEALTVKVKHIAIFAEMAPHQKERIVRALQTSHFTVAYVGDGINDVAAIHAADVGISTSNAVDVAKEAADFVLLEKDLSVLADGIYE